MGRKRLDAPPGSWDLERPPSTGSCRSEAGLADATRWSLFPKPSSPPATCAFGPVGRPPPPERSGVVVSGGQPLCQLSLAVYWTGRSVLSVLGQMTGEMRVGVKWLDTQAFSLIKPGKKMGK